MILLRTAKKKERKKPKRLGHTALSTQMLVLSLAHGSVNSLLGPLAERGVQGCREINEQLTSSHYLRSRFNSRGLAESQCRPEVNNPEQTLNIQVKKHTAENVEVKNGSDKVGLHHT